MPKTKIDNQKLVGLATRYNLKRKDIMDLLHVSQDTCDSWFTNRRRIPLAKLELLEIKLIELACPSEEIPF